MLTDGYKDIFFYFLYVVFYNIFVYFIDGRETTVY